MNCKNCGAKNDSGSQICSQCKQKLQINAPRTLSPEEHIRIGELIYAAYKHKEAGQIDEAIMACQGVLALNETSAAGHALLASLYEQRGDLAAAIFEYEKALELEPDNPTNRAKLDQLRKTSSLPQAARASSSKWSENLASFAPLIAAGSVFIIILMAAIIMMLGGDGGQQAAMRDHEMMPQTTAPIHPYARQQQQQPYDSQPVEHEERHQEERQPPDDQQDDRTAAQPPTQEQAPTPPVQPTMPVEQEGQRQPIPLPPMDQQPVITPVPDRPQPQQTEQRPEQQPQPQPESRPAPRITITTEDTSQPATIEQSVDSEQRAMQLQREGKYQEAIAYYRNALENTTNAGRIHQQIALCYQRQGNHDLAIQNYTQAIDSYRQQLSDGRDPVEVQRNIRTCEAGIELSRSQ